MSKILVPMTPEMTGIMVAYRNTSFISDLVLPPITAKKAFTYRKYNLADGFNIPDTFVGRKGTPGQVEMTYIEIDSSTDDYALDDTLPMDDITEAPAGSTPVSDAAEWLAYLIKLDRERRVAQMVFNPANHGNNVTLSGVGQYSDPNSDPLKDLLIRMDSMIVRPNNITFGQLAWTGFRMNPKVVTTILGNNVSSGMVSLNQVAEKLEVKINVGQSQANGTPRGDNTPVLYRLWGKHIAMTYQDPNAAKTKNMTYGATAVSDTFGGQTPCSVGAKGGVLVRMGNSCKEFISAPETGYLIQNAVA